MKVEDLRNVLSCSELTEVEDDNKSELSWFHCACSISIQWLILLYFMLFFSICLTIISSHVAKGGTPRNPCVKRVSVLSTRPPAHYLSSSKNHKQIQAKSRRDSEKMAQANIDIVLVLWWVSPEGFSPASCKAIFRPFTLCDSFVFFIILLYIRRLRNRCYHA